MAGTTGGASAGAGFGSSAKDYGNAIGKTLQDISKATSAATGNSGVQYSSDGIGEGNMSKNKGDQNIGRSPSSSWDNLKSFFGKGGSSTTNSGAGENAASDERTKDYVPYDKEKFSDAIANIDAYFFKYKEQFQDKPGFDDNEHVGVMAQELEENPVTKNSVIENENGIKMINTKELTLENTALLADIVRRLQALEEKIGV